MAMSVGAGRDGDPVSEINSTPLIDVMLVLLVMLIITIPPQRHAISLDTPVPCMDCPAPIDPPQPVRLGVDFDGSYSWNGEPLDRAGIEARLKMEAARQDPAEIHVEPHRLADYASVAAVLASAQRNGLKRIGVVGGT
jgi:biopolymer transport protein ExbD